MSTETSTAAPAVGTVYGVLLNDHAELARMAPAFDRPPYKAPPVAPILYIKSRNTFAGEGTAVPVPVSPGVVRIDATIGAVIGRAASKVARDDALSFVKGYVIVSDVTLPHESYYRPAVRQRCRDGFCPMSLPVAGSDFNLDTAEIVISINESEVHRRSLSTLVRPLSRLLADVSDFMTLEEGDVLLVGPPDQAPTATAGDSVRIDVAGLGTLSHSLTIERVAV